MTTELAPFVALFGTQTARTASDHAPTIKPLGTPEMRTGEWTRHGETRAVLGDPVAERLLTDLAESAKRAAHAQGYAAGWAEGRKAAEQAVRNEMAEEVAAVARDAQERHMSIEMALDEDHSNTMRVLASAIDAVTGVVDQARVTVEEQALQLAIHLTQTLLDIELGGPDGPAAIAIRRAMQHAQGEELLAIHLNPGDTGAPDTAPLTQRGVKIVADQSLQPGDALVELADGILDLRISAARARVREVLLGSLDPVDGNADRIDGTGV